MILMIQIHARKVGVISLWKPSREDSKTDTGIKITSRRKESKKRGRLTVGCAV